jgi:hypothetical protein
VIPLYGFLEGDTLGLVVLADGRDTPAVLADRLQRAARVRVAPRSPVRVVYQGRVLDPGETVAAAGMQPLERFDVVAGGAASR